MDIRYFDNFFIIINYQYRGYQDKHVFFRDLVQVLV